MIRDEHNPAGELAAMTSRLEAERPVPSAAFRGELRRRLLGSATGVAVPRRLRLLVAAYGGSGMALLAVAALGLVGAGPFAP